MKKHSIQAVAAAIAITNKGVNFSREWMTYKIIQSDISVLGLRGKTPSQTVGSILRTAKVDGEQLFEQMGKDLYAVADEDKARADSEIRNAIDALENTRRAADNNAIEITGLREQVKTLEAALDRIAKICAKAKRPTKK